ncbi:unnamed protein product [Paramecium octaurelia]|uniref:Uncharacterized protein n=1 Tax=Paramecium octaurelia TaxID=43137 RepID=A0A8S1TFA5_PAROT|nr:unnamed protein product [Paramecium octaurelia]
MLQQPNEIVDNKICLCMFSNQPKNIEHEQQQNKWTKENGLQDEKNMMSDY